MALFSLSFRRKKIFSKRLGIFRNFRKIIFLCKIVRVKRKFSRVEARGSGWIGMTSLESWKKTVKFLKKNDVKSSIESETCLEVRVTIIRSFFQDVIFAFQSLYLFSHENHTECILQNHGNLAWCVEKRRRLYVFSLHWLYVSPYFFSYYSAFGTAIFTYFRGKRNVLSNM